MPQLSPTLGISLFIIISLMFVLFLVIMHYSTHRIVQSNHTKALI